MPSSAAHIANVKCAADSKLSFERALGVSMQLYAFDTHWKRVINATSENTSAETLDADGLPLSSFPDNPDSGKPFVEKLAVDRFLVGIPIPRESKSELVFAVGEIESLDYLLGNFASLAQECESQRRHLQEQETQLHEQETQLKEQEIQLDCYADQVLHDFEERNWFEQLIGLETFDLTRSTNEIAANVLPLLGPVVNAEELLFVPAECDPQKENDECPAVSAPDRWIGECSVDPRVCRRIIEQFSSDAARHPVVRTMDSSISIQFPGVHGFGFVSVLTAGSCIGWLVVINRKTCDLSPSSSLRFGQEDFGTQEMRLLSAAATALATHHNGWRLFHENMNLAVGAIRSFASAIDAKDPYTQGHSDRVGRMAKLLASKLQLDQAEQKQLLMTGLLHDIGKIGIPDVVLSKPSKLTDQEYELLKKHPEIGFKILETIEPLNYALPGVLHHHEAFDGSGYPSGLAGQEIPYCARILAIVDSYDAMTSDRPYRNGMSFEQADEIVRAGAGTQWDPEMVALFLKHSEEFHNICRDFSHKTDRSDAPPEFLFTVDDRAVATTMAHPSQ